MPLCSDAHMTTPLMKSVLLVTLSACARPQKSDAPPVTISPALPKAANAEIDSGNAAPAAGDIVTERSYRGTLGDKRSIEVTLHRDHEMLQGVYRYVAAIPARSGAEPQAVARAIDLRGTAEADGTLALDESVNGKVTGSFRLRVAGSHLTGTWTDPGKRNTYPVHLEPRGYAPADRTTYFAFLARYARFLKKTLPPDVRLEDAIVGQEFFSIREPYRERISFAAFDYARLYVVDVNNDRTPDYVLMDRNPVGMHNDMVVGVFDEEGDSLRELPFEQTYARSLFPNASRDGDKMLPFYADSPFLESTPQGNVWRFYNHAVFNKNSEVIGGPDLSACDHATTDRFVYLWQKDRVSIVGRQTIKESCR